MNRGIDARINWLERVLDVGAVEFHWVEDDEVQPTPRRPGAQIITVRWARTPDEAIQDPSSR